MELSNERIQEMKDLLEKNKGRKFTWQEASEEAHNLAGLAELCFDLWKKDIQRKKKLKEFPKGFDLESDGYSCSICRYSASWYDKHGIKCMTCQKAIDRKEIPATLGKNKGSWYSRYDLQSYFNIKGPTLNSWIKKGILKARNITNTDNKVHLQVFLIKDNKDTLPPKKLVESHMVKETKDGKDWYHSEPWYKFVDAHEHLKSYKIMDYLRVVPLEEEKK